jgi:hypothetical protein
VGCVALDKVAIMDNRKNGSLEACQRLLELGAGGQIKMNKKTPKVILLLESNA